MSRATCMVLLRTWMVKHLDCKIPPERNELLVDCLLWEIPNVVSRAAKKNILPGSDSICNEKKHSEHDQVVVPGVIPSEVSRVYPSRYKDECDDCEDAHNGEDLILSTLYHGAGDRCEGAATRKWTIN